MNQTDLRRLLNRNGIDSQLVTEYNRFAIIYTQITRCKLKELDDAMGTLISIPTRTKQDNQLKDKLKDEIWKRHGI